MAGESPGWGEAAAPAGSEGGIPACDVGRMFGRLLEEGHPAPYHAIGSEVDRVLLTDALLRAHGNQVEASRLLGISRTTLRAKLDALGISVAKQVLSDAAHEDRGPNRCGPPDAARDDRPSNER